MIGVPRRLVPLLIEAAILVALSGLPALSATLSGFVRGASDGEALPYANVSLRGSPLGAITNQKGYYVIPGIPAGTYDVLFTYIGYRQEVRSVRLTQDQDLTLTVELRSQAVKLDAIDVRAGRGELIVEPSKLTMQTRELASVPSIAEADVFRAVQALPGVSSLSDFSSGLYVRGGSPDQNLILLDDIDVYNPNHLFGFFSTFIVDAVKTVDLQKSGYPARYGGRLSSLLDVHNRDGNRKEFAGIIRSSIIATSATLEGPWRRGSWMLAGRHTYIAPLARAAKIDLPYRFYDLQGRFNFDPGANDRTSLSYYTGSDRLNWDKPGLNVLLDWGNDTWSAQWTHILNSRLFSHFVLGRSLFDSRAIIAFHDFKAKMLNRIRDVSMKGNLSYVPSTTHLFDFGAEAKALTFSFRRESGAEDKLTFNYDGIYGAMYGQESWKIAPGWQVQAGLRLDYYSKGDYLRLGPRLSVRREMNATTAIHATYGRYSQFLNLVSQEGASFADMWFPVDRTLAPGGADHYILGLDLGPYEKLDLSIEGYYKPYRNVVEFSQEFTRSLVSPDAKMNQLFNSGKGVAYGTDVYVRNRIAGFEGWIGYSWGVTERTIPNYNFGHTYHPNYDRRQQVVLMQDRSIGKRWKLNLSFRYGTGEPVTLAVGRYTVRDINGREHDTVLEGEKNAYRLPAYHRLDLGFIKHFQCGSVGIEPNIQIINVYNRKNVYIRSYDMTKNPATYDDVHMIPFLPTIGVNVSF